MALWPSPGAFAQTSPSDAGYTGSSGPSGILLLGRSGPSWSRLEASLNPLGTFLEPQIRLHGLPSKGHDRDFSAREPVHVAIFAPLEPYFGAVRGAFWTRLEVSLHPLGASNAWK